MSKTTPGNVRLKNVTRRRVMSVPVERSLIAMNAQEFVDALTHLKVSQTAFADLVDKDERTVSRWATGDIDVPHIIGLLLTIARQHNVSGEDLHRMVQGS